MISTGPNLGLLVNGAQSEAHYEPLMRFFRGLDSLVMPRALGLQITPPVTPSDGDVYLVNVGATGDWATHDGEIARYNSLTSTWEFFTAQVGWEMLNMINTRWYRFDGTYWGRRTEDREVISIAASAEDIDLAVGTGLVSIHIPYDFDLAEVFAGLSVAQATGATPVTVDVLAAGVSIFSTPITIDNTEDTSLTAATPAVLSTTEVLKGTKISIDVSAIGDAGARGLKVYLIGWKK